MKDLIPAIATHAQLSRTAAKFGRLEFDQWVEAGRQLCLFAGSSRWWVGAWINYAERNFVSDNDGKKKYGIKYRAAIEVLGIEVQSLRESAWVEDRVDAERRRAELSWEHHRDVAPLTPAEQEKFLELAVKHRWTRSQLRQAIRKAKKSVLDEPSIDVGFVPGRWGNELRRGFQAEIERFGPPLQWQSGILESWKEGLRVAFEIYQELQAASAPQKESIRWEKQNR